MTDGRATDQLIPMLRFASLAPQGIHVKLEKFKRGRSPSLLLAKEGDFARNISAAFILSRNIQIQAEFIYMGTYYLFLVAYNSLYDAKTF